MSNGVSKPCSLYAFRRDDAHASDLPLLDGRWGDDLFNPKP